jgi:hypothetical protein
MDANGATTAGTTTLANAGTGKSFSIHLFNNLSNDFCSCITTPGFEFEIWFSEAIIPKSLIDQLPHVLPTDPKY